MPHRTAFRRATALAIMSVLVVGCGSDADDSADNASGTSDSSATSSGGDSSAAEAAEAPGLTLADPYVKAADSDMTAAFGTLVNSGAEDVTVVGATSAAAGTLELHETVDDGAGAMTMQPKQGGFVVPAGGKLELLPGGDHLMMLDLAGPLVPGEDVLITLELDDGTTVEVTATVKEIASGDEDYDPDGGMDMSGDMGAGMGAGMGGGMGDDATSTPHAS
jgi:copper(I)-binding protein